MAVAEEAPPGLVYRVMVRVSLLVQRLHGSGRVREGQGGLERRVREGEGSGRVREEGQGGLGRRVREG